MSTSVFLEAFYRFGDTGQTESAAWIPGIGVNSSSASRTRLGTPTVPALLLYSVLVTLLHKC